jgi:small conductance mechanosensitive channel
LPGSTQQRESSVDNLDQIFDPASNSFWNLLLALLAIGISVIVARYVRRWIRRSLRGYENVDTYAGAIIARVAGWTVVFLGVVLALSIMGVDMIPIVLVLVIALAFLFLSGKSLVENWAAGLLLQMRAPYRPGDRIETGDFVGDVELTNVRSVVLRKSDGQIIHVPNIEVLQNPLVNRTGDEAGRRSSLTFGVAYGTKIEDVERMLVEAAASVDGVRENPVPSAWIASLGDTAIDLELRFWTDYVSRHTVPSAVAVEALARLEAASISMPFPTQRLMIAGEIDEASGASAVDAQSG